MHLWLVLGYIPGKRFSPILRARATCTSPTMARATRLSLCERSKVQEMLIPTEVHPVFEIGIETLEGGQVQLNSMGWRGSPDFSIQRRQKGSMWRRAWVNGVDDFWSFQEPIRLMQNSGIGLLIQGSREWTDYAATADITPHLAKSAGLAVRVQGMRRFYAVRLARDGLNTTLQLIKMLNEVTVLAETSFAWELGETYELSLSVDGDKLLAQAGDVRLEGNDSALGSGGVALMIEEGRTATQTVFIPSSTEKAVDPLMEVVQNRVKSWGLAIANAYWQPVLKIRVADDAAAARFRDLEVLFQTG